jgi:WD40 repeat protein
MFSHRSNTMDVGGVQHSLRVVQSDSRYIMYISDNGTIQLWKTISKYPISLDFLGYLKSSIKLLALSSVGRKVVSGYDSGAIRLWDLKTKEEILPILNGHEPWVISVAFSSDSKNIISTSIDQTIRLWSATTGEQIWLTHIAEFGLFSAIEIAAGTPAVAFSPDNELVISRSYDRNVQILDAITGEQVLPTLHGYKGQSTQWFVQMKAERMP